MSTPVSPDSPALTPPPGIKPYFQDPFSLQPYLSLTIVGCILMTTTLVALRMFCKLAILKAVKLEDYTCFLGWACYMTMCALNWSIANHGGGKHQWNVTVEQVRYAYRYTDYDDSMYSLALLFTKLSIMLLILRVFCSVQRDIPYYLTLFLIGMNSIFYTIYFFVPFFLCQPRLKIWQKETPGTCLKINSLYLASAIFNTISDIAMLSVPLYLIWKLQMSLGRKVAVSVVFGTGGLACIASIGRVVYVVQLIRTQDYMFVRTTSTMWAIAEIAFGQVCGSLPIVPAVFRYYFALPSARILDNPSSRTAINRSPKKNRWLKGYNGTKGSEDTAVEVGGQWIKMDEKRHVNLKAEPERNGDEEAFDTAIQGVDKPKETV